jgi:hypothetical protein
MSENDAWGWTFPALIDEASKKIDLETRWPRVIVSIGCELGLVGFFVDFD